MKVMTALEYRPGIFAVSTFEGNGELETSERGHSLDTINNRCIPDFFGRGTLVQVEHLTLDNGMTILILYPTD